MSAAVREPLVRGACPGALEPMESGDGLIVRVRPHAGRIPVAALSALADAARRLGNGAVDLTRRANLQLRGLSPATLAPLRELLLGLGLLDESAARERRRNIMVSSLLGLDRSAPGFSHGGHLAHDLERAVAEAEDLAPLSAKFGILLDDGGAHLSLAGEANDIRLTFVAETRVALGLDMKAGTVWIGEAAIDDAVTHALHAARVFIAKTAGTNARRMRDCGADVADAVTSTLALAPVVQPNDGPRSTQRLGVIRIAGAPVAVVLGAPFGRVDAEDLEELSATLLDLGVDEVRLAPSRSFVVPVVSEEAADRVLAAGLAHGFLTCDADPLTKIDACPGAPACPCGRAETRAAARRLADLWPGLALRSAHISGCTKGCARSDAADLVLVARDDHFDVVRNGRADGAVSATLPLTLEGLKEARVAKES